MSLDIDVAIPEWPHFAEERRETPAGIRLRFDALYDGKRYAAAFYIEAIELSRHRMGRARLIDDARQKCLWRIRESITGKTRDELLRLDRGTRPWIDPTMENAGLE